MNWVLVLCVLATAAVALADEVGATYDSKYDNFNAHDLVENKRLLKSYAKCFNGQGSCTSEGSDFKRVIPEALSTTCGKCTPKQKELVRIVVKALQEKLPEEWAELVKSKDPEGKYKESFQAFLAGN